MKKLYRMFSGAAVAMLLAVGSSQAMAGPVYEFNFDAVGDYTGPVSGQIFGLLPGGSVPTEIVVTSGPGIGSSGVVFTPSALVFDSAFLIDGFFASFSLVAGEILSADVFGLSDDGLSFLTICVDVTDICESSAFAFVDRETVNGIIGGESDSVAFAEVPLPATVLLFLIGLVPVVRRAKVARSRFF